MTLKNWRSILVLGIGLALILGSFVIYGILVSRSILPAGSTAEERQQLIQKYGLDRPVLEQYAWFLFTFLPGLTLLGIYGTVGHRKDFQPWIMAKIFIVLLLVMNTLTILNFLVTAHASLEEALPAFWTSIVVAGLALLNFAILLVVWNGYRWSVWAFGINSFIICTLKFVGQGPIFPLLFELSTVVILIFLIRPDWQDMD